MTATLLKPELKATTVAVEGQASQQKLNALTALRFFAASMIFVGHATALAPPNRPNITEGLALWQGVSFFFVLSGFILAYVYPRISSPAQAGKFLLARFARIWPTHVMAFCVTLLLVPQCLNIPNAFFASVVNLCLLQVWTLDPVLAASFNKVSWTISVEFFFYICFPFLIKDFARPIKFRWLAAGVVALSFVALSLIPFLPGCSRLVFPEAVFVGFNPMCRILEFVLGIAICRAFTRGSIFANLKPVTGTILECLALLAAVASICLPTLWPASAATGVAYGLRSWLLDMGGAPAYGALIFLMANERGYISKLLAQKVFVWLGEISFSLYMFHLSIIFFLIKYQPSFANQPDWVFPSVAFLICLCVSHLNFKLVESPCRRKIMSFIGRDKADANRISSKNYIASTAVGSRKEIRSFAITAVEIGVTCALCLWVTVQYRFVPPALASRIETHSVPGMSGVDFGNQFKLRGVKLTHQAGGVQINTIWQSLMPERLNYVNAVQLIDSKGVAISSQDYLQDTFERSVQAGQIWEDKIFLNKQQLAGVATIGLELYQPSIKQPLIANSPHTDWGGRRLLVPLN